MDDEIKTVTDLFYKLLMHVYADDAILFDEEYKEYILTLGRIGKRDVQWEKKIAEQHEIAMERIKSRFPLPEFVAPAPEFTWTDKRTGITYSSHDGLNDWLTEYEGYKHDGK